MADLLKTLFPTIKRLDRQAYAQEYYDKWQRSMRICHESSFDKYFSFNIPDSGLSNSDLTNMMELTADRYGFCKLLISLQERNKIRKALSQFSAYIELIPLDNSQNYISALLDVGDNVENERSGFTFNNSYTQVFQHLSWFLRRIEPVSERSELLFTCFDSSCGGLAIIEFVLQADTERQNGDNLLCEDGFNKIKELFINKLNSLAQEKPEDLVSHPHLGSLIWRWRKWGNEDTVKTWIELQAQKKHNLFYILEAFITRGFSTSINNSIAKQTAKFNKESFEEFLPIKILEDSLSLLNEESLSVSQIDLVNIFNESRDKK